MASPLRIGFSACLLHRDPTRAIFKDKTLLYLEESLAHWILNEGVLAFLVPTVGKVSTLSLKDLVTDLDGIVLQGGADVSPQTYGEEPLKPEWAGDAIRDAYEIELVQECRKQKKPVLGICRGAQLLNVAYGGTLYQDIQTQMPKSLVHRNWETYDQNFHEIVFEKGSELDKLYAGKLGGKVNSVHHQAVKDLGKGVKVQARAKDDGMIEAIRVEGDHYAFAFQWHPEFLDPKDRTLLDCQPILKEFLQAAKDRKKDQ